MIRSVLWVDCVWAHTQSLTGGRSIDPTWAASSFSPQICDPLVTFLTLTSEFPNQNMIISSYLDSTGPVAAF